MRIRKLLLIHPSRSTRGLIKKYVYAELSDIEIFEAENGRQAIEQMAPKSFDVVVSTDRLKDMDITALKTRQLATPANGHTPLVIISESESCHARNALVAQGFDRVVQLRVQPSDLISNINTLCNPRLWRRDTRYHIPGMAVTINLQHVRVEAFLINISMGGILVEMTAEKPEYLMISRIDINLQVPLANGAAASIEGLRSKVLRLESIRWKPDLTPAVMRATFIFDHLENDQRSKMEELLKFGWTDKIPMTGSED